MTLEEYLMEFYGRNKRSKLRGDGIYNGKVPEIHMRK